MLYDFEVLHTLPKSEFLLKVEVINNNNLFFFFSFSLFFSLLHQTFIAFLGYSNRLGPHDTRRQ